MLHGAQQGLMHSKSDDVLHRFTWKDHWHPARCHGSWDSRADHWRTAGKPSCQAAKLPPGRLQLLPGSKLMEAMEDDESRSLLFHAGQRCRLRQTVFQHTGFTNCKHEACKHIEQEVYCQWWQVKLWCLFKPSMITNKQHVWQLPSALLGNVLFRSVICCRVSPKQKADVVDLVYWKHLQRKLDINQ